MSFFLQKNTESVSFLQESPKRAKNMRIVQYRKST